MQRIGIVSLYRGESGKSGFYNRQEIGMAKGYVSFGYECYIFFADGKDTIEEEEIAKYVKVIHCPGKKIGVHGIFDWNIIKKYNIDYVQCNFDNQIFAPNLVNFCDKNNIPIYFYIGTIKSDSKNILKNFVMSKLAMRNRYCMRTHKCFVKTSMLAKELEKNSIKSEIVPVGLDLDCIPDVQGSKEQLRAALNLPQKRRILLFIGRMDLYKRPLEYIELIKNIGDEYYAVMVGSGKLNDEVQNKINKYKLNNKISWIKSMPNRDIHAYYKACDYFINLNDHEIFGMSILEAMYQGATVIAVKAPGPNTIIKDGECGYLVTSNEEIKKLLKLNVSCDPYVVKKRIIEFFCWEKTISKIVRRLKNT